MARALVLDPDLPDKWQAGDGADPAFPRFADAPEGGITAWYTLRLTDLANDRETPGSRDAVSALKDYNERDKKRASQWNARFYAL